MDMFLSGANPDGTGDPTPYTRYFRYGCGLFSLLLLLKNYRSALPILVSAWPMGVWVATLALSLLTAFSFGTSCVQFLAFLTVIVVLFGMVVECSVNEISKILVWSMLICLLLSYFFVLFIPTYGVNQAGDIRGGGEAGFWRGAFTQKNDFGHVLGFVFLTISLGGRSVLKGTTYIIALILTLIAIIYSHCSTTPIMVMFGFVGYLTGWIIGSVRKQLAILYCSAIVGLTVVAYSFLSLPLLYLLGKDESLSGRDLIWEYGLKLVEQRPFLGWGYGYSWSTDVIEELMNGYNIPHCHNGYLELLINCGYISLISLLFVMLCIFFQVIVVRKSHNNGVIIGFFFALLYSWFASCITEPIGLRNFGVSASVGLIVVLTLLSGRKLHQQLEA